VIFHLKILDILVYDSHVVKIYPKMSYRQDVQSYQFINPTLAFVSTDV